MKKSGLTVLIVVVVLVLAGGAYALFHNSGNDSNTSNSNASSQKTSSGAAVNNAVLKTATSQSLGQYLTDPSGKALYTYDNDTPGVSNCTGACLSEWPAYTDTGSTTGLPSGVSTITRADNGSQQYTYNGKPLYYFLSDPNGQATGNGKDSFSVARPTASGPSSTNSSSSSSSTNDNSSSNYPY